MADYNSSLPVRTEHNGDVAIFIADGTTPSQVASVDTHGSLSSIIRDASGSAVTTQANGSQQALDVGINVAGVQIDPRSIRALTSGVDSVTAVQGTSPWVVSLPYDENYGTVGATTLRTAAQIGNATGAADFNAGATGAQTLRTQANQGAPNTAANGWPVKPTDGTNSQSFTGAGEAKVDVTQPLPIGTNNIGKVSIQDSSGNPFTPTNPLFVTVSDTVGSPVDNYNTSASLAAGGTSNHDYTVTALKTFYTKQFWASASGKLKVEIQYETAAASGIFNSVWVGFNSTSTPNIPIPVLSGKTQVTGAKIRIIRTNEDKAAMDVYSTISGVEQ